MDFPNLTKIEEGKKKLDFCYLKDRSLLKFNLAKIILPTVYTKLSTTQIHDENKLELSKVMF